MASDTHMVTGGSGFIAIHLVNQLLQAGYNVHTTVRDLTNTRKVQPLRDLQEKYPGKLDLFEADLLKPGSFEPAIKDCSVVHHVASPFLMAEKIKDGQKDMVDPALQGTRNVLNSVNSTETVKRVVLTSTSKNSISTDIQSLTYPSRCYLWRLYRCEEYERQHLG